ncbi:hypothetical protein FRC12_017721 [Ceratobasidium sp. 428]|nr:hypothetical protein FRC12_017721 [Ceratobasidium sp. 428]
MPAVVPLPAFIERRQDGKIRCTFCFPPELSQPDDGWIARSSFRKHLETSAHQDSCARKEDEEQLKRIAQVHQAPAALLNNPSDPPVLPYDRSPSPWPVNDISHIDPQGVSTYDFENVHFSAGADPKALLIEKSRSILAKYGVEEIPLDDEPEETEEDASLGSLPQQIMDQLELDGDDKEVDEIFGAIGPAWDWLPYKNKTRFLLDLLDSIPRLRLSTAHLKLIFWIMKEIERKDIPSLDTFRNMQKHLRKTTSIQSHRYRSVHGNVFEMMDVPQLVGRDFSNPLVAPHINVYPEVSAKVSEAWQSAKWQEHVPLDQLTPMYAANGKHFYVNELSRLHDGSLVIPRRWIKRDGGLTADCQRVVQAAGEGMVSRLSTQR